MPFGRKTRTFAIVMNDDFEDVQFSPILNYPYARWFREGQYNGRTPNEAERAEIVTIIDENVASYSDGVPIIVNALNQSKEFYDDFHELYKVILSAMLFVIQTMTDAMVVSKYFILADNDYDKRLMRGKLAVILNEGFKKLYGFENKTITNSVWVRLKTIIQHFPKEINLQYFELTTLLERHAKSSSWWKVERNIETHLDAEKLYLSRCEKLIEGKVLLDSLKLLDALNAVYHFLENMHSCFLNTLTYKYLKGELPEE